MPFVGDSKRAMDEYTSEICMGGHNTIVMHNTCEVGHDCSHICGYVFSHSVCLLQDWESHRHSMITSASFMHNR